MKSISRWRFLKKKKIHASMKFQATVYDAVAV